MGVTLPIPGQDLPLPSPAWHLLSGVACPPQSPVPSLGLLCPWLLTCRRLQEAVLGWAEPANPHRLGCLLPAWAGSQDTGEEPVGCMRKPPQGHRRGWILRILCLLPDSGAKATLGPQVYSSLCLSKAKGWQVKAMNLRVWVPGNQNQVPGSLSSSSKETGRTSCTVSQGRIRRPEMKTCAHQLHSLAGVQVLPLASPGLMLRHDF